MKLSNNKGQYTRICEMHLILLRWKFIILSDGTEKQKIEIKFQLMNQEKTKCVQEE